MTSLNVRKHWTLNKLIIELKNGIKTDYVIICL